MARRRKTSPMDDITEVIALLPWWAAVILGIVSYFVLHAFAALPAAVSIRPGEMGGIVRTMVTGLASVGQYILPLMCFAAAVMSAVRRRQREGLVSNALAAEAPDALDGMSWKQFEVLVGEAFRLQGYLVTDTGGGGPDGGIDLVLRKDREKFLVQCKQWKAFKVSVQVVRELYGVMAANGAAGGFVVTSGRFTEDAVEFAMGRNVTLVDGPKLFGMIQQAQASLGSQEPASAPFPARPANAPARGSASQAKATTTSRDDAPPTCPTCSREMKLKTAKRGANAGGTFWGCTGYPECRGTRSA